MTAPAPAKSIKRTPAKIGGKIQRTPVKVQKSASAQQQNFQSLFGALAPPQQQLLSANLQAVSPKNVTPEQLKALSEVNFLLWVLTSGIKVDHRPFDFDRHKYLIPLYVDRAQEVILMKAAQLGATIWLLLRLIHFCKTNPAKACLFFPTDEGVKLLSKDRLAPLIASNAELASLVKDTDTLGYKQIGEESSLYLRHLGGVASKDSTPFDMIAFDEVRLLDAADIYQARERVSHSSHKYVLQVSTAGYPNHDIHKQFLRGTQNYWHTKCNCPDGVILSEVFPDCMAVTDKKIYYRCPRCKMRIDDPQNGQFVPHNPGAPVQSYHIHQMLSKFISASEIWENYKTTTNIKEFFNAKLGKPYVDEENIPITDDDLQACVNTDIMWMQHTQKAAVAMGIDQMGGNNYIIIAKRLSGGKKRILHYEIVDDQNSIYWEAGKRVTPFKRGYQLMKEYDVDLCIIDAMPNANEAMEFARAFPKRVFVAWYVEQQREIVHWGDRPKYKMLVRKGGPQVKFKYTCLLSRYLSIDLAMRSIAEREVEWPEPRALVQECRNPKTGYFEPLHIFETHFYEHMKSIVRQKTIINEDTGAFKMEWVNLGLDPHSVHAWNYCNMALERLRRTPLMTFA